MLACAQPRQRVTPAPYSLPAPIALVSGCWELTTGTPIVAVPIAEIVVVRLDTTVLVNMPPHLQLAATAVHGFPLEHKQPPALAWHPLNGGDSLALTFQRRGGLAWQLGISRDSLHGSLNYFADIGPTRISLGPSSGHRVPCPKSAA
jgi:hypothetical protein